MENELISKKDLLEHMDISYGQLYRWKRKNLIPEDWFIRKSTFTGQETFFPKDKILKRIDKIVNMKDHLSLDEIADQVSPNPTMITLEIDLVMKQNMVSNAAMELFRETNEDIHILKFDQLLKVFILDKGLKDGAISLEEGRILLNTMDEHYDKFQGKAGELLLVRKMGVATCFLVSTPNDIYFESEAKVVFRENLTQAIEKLKNKITVIKGV